MAPTSLTLDYGALLSTTLFNYSKTLADNISKNNAVLNMLTKNGFYLTVDDPGERAQIALMNAIPTGHFYAGYDEMDTTPQEGITSAFSDWRLFEQAISISGEEKIKNKGEAKIIDLMQSKVEQAELGAKETVNRALIIGNGANIAAQITTAYTDPLTGRLGPDPIPKLVDFTPATGSVQGIDPAVETWWRNQADDDTSTTFAGFLTELDNMHGNCSKGPLGEPDFHLTDQRSFQLYKAALRSQNRFVEFTKADLPFRNVAFYGMPIAWDELTPNAGGDTATQSATSGTWYMFNSKTLRMKVVSERNWNHTEFRTPVKQDATVAFILWMGALMVNNRRKNGVLGGIDSTIVA